MNICDVMHKGVVTCSPDCTARDAAKTMAGNKIRSIVVVDEFGEVWGLVSIMEIIGLYGQDLSAVSVGSVIRPYRIEVDALWPVEKAVEMMKKMRIDHLIIVDPNAGPKRPVAILTSYDIVLHMSGINTGRFQQVLTIENK